MTAEAALSRIDPFPYQHRLAEVMSSPVETIDPKATCTTAAATMRRLKISSLLILDAVGRPAGIITERDLLNAIAELGAAALDLPVGARMSGPIVSLPPDAFVFTALARMAHSGFRHMPVVDPVTGKAIGMVTAGGVLKLRAQQALVLADDIGAAKSAQELAAVQARLPAIAGGLLKEGIGARQIAAVISAVLRDISGRAAELACESLEAEGRQAPARWCYLVLGSGGRGESLLAADQDNALIHDAETDDDPWLAELGKRASELLNGAGIPFCPGQVMAMNRNLRHNLKGWREEVAFWIEALAPEALLNADIFYDFLPVAGDFSLAAALRETATGLGQDPGFIRALAGTSARRGTALNIFGRFREEGGRVDLKRGGLLPIVSGGRVLALRLGCPATATPERWRAAVDPGFVRREDFARIDDAHEMILELILSQQLADLGAGRTPGTAVEVRRLLGLSRERLKQALKIVGEIDLILNHVLGP
jgi:signal-transduction protein with cAMP-binding, CBS, and nucleotidyltransferase domain